MEVSVALFVVWGVFPYYICLIFFPLFLSIFNLCNKLVCLSHVVRSAHSAVGAALAGAACGCVASESWSGGVPHTAAVRRPC